jgi:hypothetical protein
MSAMGDGAAPRAGTAAAVPAWVLPLLEAVLLVAVIVGDPGEITRRSALLRVISIGLVAVLVASALWTTVLLIDDLLHGGSETNSASALLSAGGIVWVSNSPTDTMPLVPWAKVAMAVQSMISLAILGLVVARAVNLFA